MLNYTIDNWPVCPDGLKASIFKKFFYAIYIIYFYTLLSIKYNKDIRTEGQR